MAHSKFSLDGLEDSTTQVIPPDHVEPLGEEEEVLEAGVDTQLFQTPPGLPVPQEEQAEQTNDASENSVLKCIMEDAPNQLHAFKEYEHYSLGVNSESDCDVPEDELTDEMEDVSSDEDQLDPVNLQEEEDFTVQGDHHQPNPVEDNIVTECNETSQVNLHVTVVKVTEDPSTPRGLDFNIVTFYTEADEEVIPENQLNVKVQTVTTTSAAEGESNRILMDIHMDPKLPECEDSYELLHETVNGDSIDSKDVDETASKRAIEAGALET